MQRIESLLPLSRYGLSSFVAERGQAGAADHTIGGFRAVAPGYFRTLEIPLIAGRDFDSGDTADPPQVAIVNAAMARAFWPGARPPLGKRISLAISSQPYLYRTIVGVAMDVREFGLAEEPRPEVYLPYTQNPELFCVPDQLLVRSLTPLEDLAPLLRREIRGLDPEQAVADIRTLDEVVAQSLAPRRFNMLVLSLFATAALVLSAVGLYGTIYFTASRRRHEIGVRIALGARRVDVVRLIVGRGMNLTFLGIAVGAAAALAAARLLTPFVYGIAATDVATFTAAMLLLGATAFTVSYLPALQATTRGVVNALRHD